MYAGLAETGNPVHNDYVVYSCIATSGIRAIHDKDKGIILACHVDGPVRRLSLSASSQVERWTGGEHR